MDSNRHLSLRPVNDEDRAFLVKVYASTRAEELALTNWDSAQRDAFLEMQFTAQQLHYGNYFPQADHRIILVGDEAVGRLYVARLEDQIRILDITLLNEHRGKGTGERLIGELMSEAASAGKPLRIYVESFNRSLTLFERLGFARAAEQGYSYLMEWRPK
jgi:RimJ/RimL family protein N-acetyltransferase